MNCGLLGRKLGHSYSPYIHSLLADYSYHLYEVEPLDLESFLKSSLFDGLNVTMPYKKAVIPYCSKLTTQAEKLGAVNTIIREKDGSLIGHNSDYFGFSSMLAQSNINISERKVLVLGSGGASAVVSSVLKERNANVIIVSRTGENNYNNLEKHKDASVIVNTTPVGMYPNTGISPIPIDLFPHLEGVLDVIYNPFRTQFLMDAEQRGVSAVNGLWMLVAQAKESAELFTGTRLSNDSIKKVYDQILKQKNNVVLIGMPGSGKTSIAKSLAEAMGKSFIDSDAVIESRARMSIPRIFELFGERGFRDLESDVLKDLGKKSALVIATGGGCVTQVKNYPLLHQNASICWIQRDIDQLAINGRPLSQTNCLADLYAERKPMYARFSDYAVENNAEIAEAVKKILIQEAFI